ncbi:MAG: aminotransferase class I/II-fold pyridoxal phosphate-dependent enzyme [Candidatus Zixiibacteriota bacterium]
MNSFSNTIAANIEDLIMMVSHKIKVDKKMIYPFADSTSFIAELLKVCYKPQSNFISVGHATPDIAIAVDRADINLIEEISEFPFTGNIEEVLPQIETKYDIVYLANPNRITGATYSLADIEQIAKAVPGGTLIIDEYYYEYLGITGMPLLDIYTNIVIIRSFTAQFGIYSSDTGYAVTNPTMIKTINHNIPSKQISPTLRRSIFTATVNHEALSFRLKEIHDESLRIVTRLHELGVQSRLTATDFLLIRVADPKNVGSFLNRYKIQTENLDSYRFMNNYIKYRLESPLSNDKLLEAFKKMPVELFKMKTIDRRAVKMRHAKENKENKENRIKNKVLTAQINNVKSYE